MITPSTGTLLWKNCLLVYPSRPHCQSHLFRSRVALPPPNWQWHSLSSKNYFSLQSVEGENHEKAVELLKQAQGSVKLVVRYTPKVLEEMEMRFDKQRAARRRQYPWASPLQKSSFIFYCRTLNNCTGATIKLKVTVDGVTSWCFLKITPNLFRIPMHLLPKMSLRKSKYLSDTKLSRWLKLESLR